MRYMTQSCFSLCAKANPAFRPFKIPISHGGQILKLNNRANDFLSDFIYIKEIHKDRKIKPHLLIYRFAFIKMNQLRKNRLIPEYSVYINH